MLAPTMARRIELWPIDKFIPYARNARTHSAAIRVILDARGPHQNFCPNLMAMVRGCEGMMYT